MSTPESPSSSPSCLGDEPEVADPGRRHVQGGDRAHVRLVPGELGDGELVDLDTVEAAAAGELGHAWQLVR